MAGPRAVVSRSSYLVAIYIGFIVAATASATQYVVDVPQLIGLHGTAPYTVVDVNQQLPTAFSQIDSGILWLIGEQFPGSITDFFTHIQGPTGAILLLEDSFPVSPFTPYPYFEYHLPDDLHEFSLEIPIGVAYQAVPDFQQWLDGTAEFSFSVGPPPTTGSYVTNPLVRIDNAKLVLNGQAVPEPTAILFALVAFESFIAIVRVR